MSRITDIREISVRSQNSHVNVELQINFVGEVISYPSRIKRQYVNLVDQYNSTINLVLWNEYTSIINTNFAGRVLVIDDALVNYYNQKAEIKYYFKTKVEIL